MTGPASGPRPAEPKRSPADPSPEAIAFAAWLTEQHRLAQRFVDDTDVPPEPMPATLRPRYAAETIERAMWETEARLERIIVALSADDDLGAQDDARIALVAAQRARRGWFRRDEIAAREGGAQ